MKYKKIRIDIKDGIVDVPDNSIILDYKVELGGDYMFGKILPSSWIVVLAPIKEKEE